MVWDFETAFVFTVGVGALLLYLWAKYYSSDFDFNDPRGKAFKASVVFCALFLICGFDIVCGFVAPAEIRGQVSQVELESAGRSDHSNFEITSQDGLQVRIASAHNLVALLSIGENLRVTYNPWSSFPYKIECLEGSRSKVLLSNPRHRFIDWIFLLVFVIGGAYSLRSFRMDAP